MYSYNVNSDIKKKKSYLKCSEWIGINNIKTVISLNVW